MTSSVMVVLLCQPILARDVKFNKKVDAGALQGQLKSAGFLVNYIDCSRDECTVHMPGSEKKNPMPVVKKYVYVDPFEIRKQRLTTIRGLYLKWKSNTISPAEKDDLLKMMVQQFLGE